MKGNLSTKVGGLFSIIAGILFMSSGILFVSFQINRFDWNSLLSIIQYLESAPDASMIWTWINWGAAVASLFAIANVQALASRFKDIHEDLVRWSSVLAILGYSIIAVTNVADLHHIQQLALGYPGLSGVSQNTLEVLGVGSLDPDLNLRFLTLGPWFLTIGTLALFSHQNDKPLGYLGILLGVAALLLVVANWLEQEWILPIAALLAVMLHPVWLIWTGITLFTPRG